MTFEPHDNITRAEVERAFDRVEGRMQHKQEEILKAVADLKLAMNGQFAAQGVILTQHERAIGILQDRAGRDNSARLTGAAAMLLAALASYFGLKP